VVSAKLRQPELERVPFFVGPTDIQVRMIEGVDRAEAIACLESRPSPDPHSRQPARRVPGWNEPHVVEWAAIRVATDAKVHVGDRTHADGLVERVEGRHAVKLCDDSFADGENTRAGGRGDVQPRLETWVIDTASPGDAVARQGRDESIRSDTSNRARRTLRRVDYRFAAIGAHFQAIWKDRPRRCI
jgi:hypothetical protein